MQEEDLAMPLDIRDPASGMDYFTAAQMLGRAIDSATPIQTFPSIPFWEHIFPMAAGPASSQIFGFAPCANGAAALSPGSSVTATQAMYNMWSCIPSGNATSALFNADVPLGYPNPGAAFQHAQPSAAKPRGSHSLTHSFRRSLAGGA